MCLDKMKINIIIALILINLSIAFSGYISDDDIIHLLKRKETKHDKQKNKKSLITKETKSFTFSYFYLGKNYFYFI